MESGRRPVLQRQDRDGRELPLVHLLPEPAPATTGTSLPFRRTTARRRLPSTPTPSVSGRTRKNPDAAFTVLQYLLGGRGRCSDADLRRHAGTRGPAPGFFDDARAGFGTLQKPIDWQVAIDGIDHADMPNFESPLPFNTSGENTTTSPLSAINTYATRWDTTPGWTWISRSRRCSRTCRRSGTSSSARPRAEQRLQV